MQPAALRATDAVFNSGFALAAAQLLPEGVWIAMNGVLHALVRPGEKGVAAGDASAERKLQVGGVVLTLLFVVQLIIMIWKPGV